MRRVRRHRWRPTPHRIKPIGRRVHIRRIVGRRHPKRRIIDKKLRRAISSLWLLRVLILVIIGKYKRRQIARFRFIAARSLVTVVGAAMRSPIAGLVASAKERRATCALTTIATSSGRRCRRRRRRGVPPSIGASNLGNRIRIRRHRPYPLINNRDLLRLRY